MFSLVCNAPSSLPTNYFPTKKEKIIFFENKKEEKLLSVSEITETIYIDPV
jgi:hypothetical protein